jgi:hypothetical protein
MTKRLLCAITILGLGLGLALPLGAQAAKKKPAEPAKVQRESKPSEWHLGLTANAEVFTINLTTRKKELGFTPGLAVGVQWQPPWWKLSECFLGIDALVDAEFRDINLDDDFDYFQINAMPVLNLAGMITVGLGGSFNLSLNPDAKDTLELLFSFGLSTPIGLGSRN